jgi:putative ABC transport system ATP-binding protein
MDNREFVYDLKEVTRYFRRGASEVRAVDSVDLQVKAGEFLVIRGASGSGKTTLLQLLGGLEKPSSGSLVFEGDELSSMDDGELTDLRSKAIGFVFQNFNLIPTLTASENVEAGLARSGLGRKQAKERAAAALGQVGLTGRKEHLPTNLSGGEQQRVAIARALAKDPRVLLADEPTGNLDTRTGQEIVDLLRNLSAGEGRTIVLVTHADYVAESASRSLFMKDGRLDPATSGA